MPLLCKASKICFIFFFLTNYHDLFVIDQLINHLKKYRKNVPAVKRYCTGTLDCCFQRFLLTRIFLSTRCTNCTFDNRLTSGRMYLLPHLYGRSVKSLRFELGGLGGRVLRSAERVLRTLAATGWADRDTPINQPPPHVLATLFKRSPTIVPHSFAMSRLFVCRKVIEIHLKYFSKADRPPKKTCSDRTS